MGLSRTSGRFFILPIPIPKEYIPRLMGLFITDPSNPTRSYRPKTRLPSSIATGLTPDPIPLSPNQVALAASDASAATRLKGLMGALSLSASAGTEQGQALSIKAEEILCYAMEQIPDVFASLIADEECRAEVGQLMRTSRENLCFMITGFLTVSGKTEWIRSVWGKQDMQMLGAIPLDGGQAGLGINAEVGGGLERNVRRVARGEVLEDQTVFAVAYDVVMLKKRIKRSVGKPLSFVVESKLKLGGEKRALWNHLSMRGEDGVGEELSDEDSDDDDDEDEFGELTLAEIGERGQVVLPS